MMDASTERKPEKVLKTQFILSGFSQTAGIRMYAFEGVADGRRVHYTVDVNLALIPGYGIRIQDLPLLCRDFLGQQPPDAVGPYTFTEEEMRSHAERLALARSMAPPRKRPVRHTATPNHGPADAWRVPFR